MNSYTSTSKNKLFVFISLFIVAILLIAYIVILEQFTRKYIVKTSSYHSQTTKIMKSDKNKEVVLIGSSHAGGYGIYVEKKNNYFLTYGKAHTYPHVMYAKIQLIRKYQPNIKYLLLEADTHQFYDFAMNNKTSYTKFYRELLEAQIDINNILLMSFDDEVKPILHKRLSSHINRKFSHLFFEEEPNKQKAKAKVKQKAKQKQPWYSLSNDKKSRLIRGRQALFKFNNKKSVMNKDALKFFEMTIEYAQKNNIEVILIQHPMDINYLNAIPKKAKQDVENYLNKISVKYNLKVLNYQYVYSNYSNYFLNQDHLNKLGIKEFSKVLLNDLNSITQTQ